ncbi:MAG TPA: tRNA (adenosine(37)-N6)-threonylcarbamoyltransferase complex dimerization subunit type 1 TsaB [Methylococcaceae bacterium]|nr:tRNA (adenosine(37)-N6)-threonylcarbamoyltransferase complex dimerization subunit type 1 TsaB [Methylococcaceae bacterium]
MKLLAVESATDACSAALWLDGEVLERYAVEPRRHSTLLLPMLDELLAEAGLELNQLDGLSFGRGPGSFTGVRIATGVIQGIALAADLPVAPVSTLAALALQAFDATDASWAFAGLDARMDEVYWGVYRRDPAGGVHLWNCESVGPAAAVAFPENAAGVGVGSAWDQYHAILAGRLDASVPWLPGCQPRAGHIARLAALDLQSGLGVAAENALPVYLRDTVVKKPALRPANPAPC